MSKIRVCDINDFFTMTGGGVRRYHLEKLRYMARQDDVEYHLIVPSSHAGVEIHGTAPSKQDRAVVERMFRTVQFDERTAKKTE